VECLHIERNRSMTLSGCSYTLVLGDTLHVAAGISIKFEDAI
jgi:hypothetical protein